VNPRSRRAATGRWRPIIEQTLAGRFAPEFLYPDSAGAIAATARALAEDGCPAIVVGGGDGTINCVVNAIAGCETALGVLPLGTGNDLARFMRIPLDLQAAAERIITGQARRIDLLDVNGRQFCTVGGLGLVSESGLTVSRAKSGHPLMARTLHVLGTRVYSLAGAANILLCRDVVRHLRVQYFDSGEGQTREITGLFHGLFAANQPNLGGGLQLPIASDNADGAFELCLLTAGTRTRLLTTLVLVSGGRSAPPGVLQTCRVLSATIESDRDETFFGDGEWLADGRSFRVQVVAGGLAVIC
jgi:diacylglycerol kinase family enzyme